MNPSASFPNFDLEKQLIAALHDGSPRALNLSDRWLQICPEVTVKQRIADLVLIHASTAPNSKPARVSYFEAAIVAFLLDRGSANVQTIADELYSSASSVELRVSRLARLGLIEIDGRELRATGRHVSGDIRVVAIEAKLSRWREAVEQASSYRIFANESYIAMPTDIYVRSGEIWTACRHAEVGALAVRGDGTVDLVFEAPHVTPHSAEWVRLLSSFVGVAHVSKAFCQFD
jgi:hypothetical protein